VTGTGFPQLATFPERREIDNEIVIRRGNPWGTGLVCPAMRTRTRSTSKRFARIAAAGAAVGIGAVAAAGPAGACGGLVGENGSISLVRTSTLAAWHDGVEHYVTSFEFTGSGESVGSIVPLPGEPTNVEAAGEWTLQRLQLEVAPPAPAADFDSAGGEAASRSAEVILETQVDALDITILRGGGDEVGQWALENGFFLTPDAPEVLDFYGDRSQYFMAAKFDAERAAEQGLSGGQGTPVHLEIPTEQPWVPLRILGLGLEGSELVEADVFLLTDDEPELLAGGEGLRVNRSEQANTFLLDDLRSDRNMDWVPEEMWFTHLTLGEEAGDLDYDLSVSAPGERASLVDAGLSFAGIQRSADAVDPANVDDGTDTRRVLTWVALTTGIGLVLAAGWVQLRQAKVDR
jgi:hypothetical protein